MLLRTAKRAPADDVAACGRQAAHAVHRRRVAARDEGAAVSAMPPRRRLGLAVGLLAAVVLLATLAAVTLATPARSLADGLRALAGDGVETPGPAAEPRPDGAPADAVPAVVERVVDGDTIRVRVEERVGSIEPDGAVPVRLLNLDAPELDHPDRGEDCGATEARAFLEGLLRPGSRVHLVADVEDRDQYGRALRGAWNEQGRFVNAEVVRAGWAEVVLYAPNDRFHDPLAALEAEARARARGAWGRCGGFPS